MLVKVKPLNVRVFSFPLCLLLIRLLEISSWGQNFLRGKYREWIEDNDRIEVRSWYAETEVSLEHDWSIEFLGTVDAWSGATPYGLPPSSATSKDEWLHTVSEEISLCTKCQMPERTKSSILFRNKLQKPFRCPFLILPLQSDSEDICIGIYCILRFIVSSSYQANNGSTAVQMRIPNTQFP